MGMGQLDLSLKNMFKSMVEGPNSLYYDVSFKTWIASPCCVSVYFSPTFYDDIDRSKFIFLKNQFSKCAKEFLHVCVAGYS